MYTLSKIQQQQHQASENAINYSQSGIDSSEGEINTFIKHEPSQEVTERESGIMAATCGIEERGALLWMM